MKTPDKIYIAKHNVNVQTGYFSRNRDDIFTQEYIHKDTLVEWIQEVRTIPHDNAIARDNAFVEIINIINSIK